MTTWRTTLDGRERVKVFTAADGHPEVVKFEILDDETWEPCHTPGVETVRKAMLEIARAERQATA